MGAVAHLDDYRPPDEQDTAELFPLILGEPGNPRCSHRLIDVEFVDRQLVICSCAFCGAQTRQWGHDWVRAAWDFKVDLAKATYT